MAGGGGDEGDTTYVGAFPAAAAGGAVEEVLLHAIARARSERRRRARERAVLAVAGIGVVVRGIGAHQGLALHIPRCALSAGALQLSRPVATILTVGSGLIRRTTCRTPRAHLLRVADARASPADGTVRGKLASPAATVVRVIADGVVHEFASRGIAALVAATTLGSATIAIFALFDDAVAALGTGNGDDAFVVGKTGGVDTVTANSRANVADATKTELRDATPSGGIHDVLRSCVTCRAAKRTTLLRVHRVAVVARLTVTVVNSTESVSSLVSDDLPFGGSPRDDIGSAHNLG